MITIEYKIIACYLNLHGIRNYKDTERKVTISGSDMKEIENSKQDLRTYLNNGLEVNNGPESVREYVLQ